MIRITLDYGGGGGGKETKQNKRAHERIGDPCRRNEGAREALCARCGHTPDVGQRCNSGYREFLQVIGKRRFCREHVETGKEGESKERAMDFHWRARYCR